MIYERRRNAYREVHVDMLEVEENGEEDAAQEFVALQHVSLELYQRNPSAYNSHCVRSGWMQEGYRT